MNMLDYLRQQGNISFREQGLNEVDNLIFSTLVYLKFEKLRYDAERRSFSMQELFRLCEISAMDTSDTPCDPVKLLRAVAATKRYRDVQAHYYKSHYDVQKQIQFAAVTWQYDQDRYYIAFRGTDNTLTGWREDYNLAYLTQTPGQSAARDYINFVAEKIPNRSEAAASNNTAPTADLIIGGHSKGGNLAVYGAAFCREEIRNDRIAQVYSNDGPGFNSTIAESQNYLAILDKVLKIIPESSYVGILFSSKARRKIIVSSAKGKGQHNPYSWSVQGTEFEPADSRSFSSMLMDRTFSAWIDSLSPEEKQLIVDSLFDTLESTGAETLRELSSQKKDVLVSSIKTILAMGPDNRKQMLESFGKFINTSRKLIKKESDLIGKKRD